MTALRAPRFFGDAVLESCLSGHRMFDGSGDPPESVAHIQQALTDLGFTASVNGIFDSETGNAVIAFKTAKGLIPNDAVVGPGTMAALDGDFAHELFDAKAKDLAGTRFDLGSRIGTRLDVVDGFAICTFANGVCMEVGHVMVYAIPAPALIAWAAAGGLTGSFGLPTADPIEIDASRAVQEFTSVTFVFGGSTDFALPRQLWEASVAGQGFIGGPTGPPQLTETGNATFVPHDRGVVLAAPEMLPQPLPRAVFDLWNAQEASVSNPADGFFARFDPVTPPLIVPRTGTFVPRPAQPGVPDAAPERDLYLSPGESVERLVIRSNAGRTPEEYLLTLPRFERSVVPDECGPFPRFRAADYHATADRHIAPPKIGSEIAETHGMFDTMTTAEIAAAKNKAGTVPVIEAQAALPVSYLPDPLALGACFVGLPGPNLGTPFPPLSSASSLDRFLDGFVTQIPFNLTGSQWPNASALRLRVVGIEQNILPAPPDFNPETRVLTVQIPQAEIVRFRISSYLEAPNLDLMGVWRWIEEGVGKRQESVIQKTELLRLMRGLGVNGLHWMLTPHREIMIVHAVQQPLLEPLFNELVPRKFSGGTYAEFRGEIRCDGKSTGKLDVVADWDEPLDDPADPTGPHCATGPNPPIPHKAHAFALSLNFKGPIVTGQLNQLTDGSRTIGVYDHLRRALTFGNNDTLQRHVFGDTKHRFVSYTAVATTRFREYFHCVITTDENNVTLRSPQVARHIPSSARPDAPKVLYVVPTFGWERTKTDNSIIKSTRRGGGLRVYLERPWFSSGDGEMLGVVLWPSELPEEESQLSRIKPYITRLGLDPIWTQARLPLNLSAQDFKLAKVLDPTESPTTGLTFQELDGETPFTVAPHEVAYDGVRRLWYCDIEIDPGSAYFPFVRLALVRYQPHSAERAVSLSRVVLADFAQLTPDRLASVSFAESGRIQIRVSGNAFAESLDGVENQVTATLQQRASVDADLGWTDVGGLSVVLRRANAEAGVKLNFWSGVLTLPPNRQPGANRLLIQEFEQYRFDDSPDGGRAEFRKRLVYAEALEV